MDNRLYKNNEEMKYIPIAEPQLGEKERNNLLSAFDSTWISSMGEYIAKFENRFSSYIGRKHGVSTSNGTAALHLAMLALGVGRGDEVIVPDITFAATINAVLYVGATPVIVDIEKDGWCIDPEEIERALTAKTKAVIPVHIYGQPCNMERIMGIAKEHDLYVIEDCAEAHGAKYDGKLVGSFGDVGCFSFFGNKIITTGEGGMCLTDIGELDERMRLLRDHGMNKRYKYYHEAVGFNYRMTNLQASIGVAQMDDIDNKLKWRRELERKYKEALGGIPEVHFQRDDLDKREKVTWLVTAYVDDGSLRDKILDSFSEHKIDARPYFVPLSHMDIYKDYVFSNTVSGEVAKLGLNLPTSASVGDQEMGRIVKVLKNAFK